MGLSTAFFVWVGFALILPIDETPADVLDVSLLVVAGAATGAGGLGAIAAARADNAGPGAVAFIGILTAVPLVWFLMLFAEDVFPRIPQQLGGGAGRQARLLVTADSRTEASALGISFAGGLLSRPVTVVYEGDVFYVLKLHDGQVVQLAKDKVLGGTSDSKAPSARSVQTSNGAQQRGVSERGDRLVLSFSEPVDPASVLPGWDGTSWQVELRLRRDAGSNSDRVSFHDGTHAQQLNLGTVTFTAYDAASPADALRSSRAHVEMAGRDAVVTLDEPLPLSKPRAGHLLSWAPSVRAHDPGDNPVTSQIAEEPREDGSLLHSKPEF